MNENTFNESTMPKPAQQNLEKFELRKLEFYFFFACWLNLAFQINETIFNSKTNIAMIQKKITQRSCRGPISIKRIDPKGEYIVIENTCIRKVN